MRRPRLRASAARYEEVDAVLFLEVLKVMVVAAEIDIRTAAQHRKQLLDEGRRVPMVPRGVDRVMPVNHLPACGAAIELLAKPEKLRRRNFLCVDREELGGSSNERVIEGGHGPAGAPPGVEDLRRRAVGQFPVMVPEHRIEADADRAVEILPLARPTGVGGARHSRLVEVVAEREAKIEGPFLMSEQHRGCRLPLFL